MHCVRSIEPTLPDNSIRRRGWMTRLARNSLRLTAYGAWLIDSDSKCSAWKSLQGKIWREGYRTGDLRGEVYPDVPPAFARWSRQGKTISIFSSGSVLAQKLLFGSTAAGDLTGFLSAYFDTTTGPKNAPESYLRIAGTARTGSVGHALHFRCCERAGCSPRRGIANGAMRSDKVRGAGCRHARRHQFLRRNISVIRISN